MTVFLGVTLCFLLYSYIGINILEDLLPPYYIAENGSAGLLQGVGIFLPDSVLSHCKRLQSTAA
jgi:hypothetical protein